MKTRNELWKEYRNEIEKNINLHQIVIKSNKKLSVLYERLLVVFPDYENKYEKIVEHKNTILETNFQPTLPSNKDLKAILNELKLLESTIGGKKVLDDINFHSKELHNVIKNFEKGTQQINIKKQKEINLKHNMKRINIAIDGPSGTGKSSAAKEVAKRLGYKYINTGLVYRAIALHCINNNINIKKPKKVASELSKMKIILLKDEKVELNEQDVSKEIRSDDVSKTASIIAAIPKVRKWAVELQQRMASEAGVVMDGRDTTFAIMPSAELKIFLETNLKVRTNRRVEQNKVLGFSTNYDDIFKELEERDNRDRNRKKDPLHRVADAVLIDSSDMSLEEVINKIYNMAIKIMKDGK